MVRQRMPVAFVAAAPLTPQLSGIRYYLAPAAVVEQRGILAWRLQIDAPQTLAGRDITILNAREAAPVR